MMIVQRALAPFANYKGYMVIIFEFINGLQFGIEHIGGEEDDEYIYAVVANVAVFRFVFMKMKETS